jgi:hypothetical protein
MLREELHVGLPVKIRMRITGRYEVARVIHIPTTAGEQVRLSCGDRMIHRHDGDIEPRDYVPPDRGPRIDVQHGCR